jgi:hypothetical protein
MRKLLLTTVVITQKISGAFSGYLGAEIKVVGRVY